MADDLDHFKELSAERWKAHNHLHAVEKEARDLLADNFKEKFAGQNEWRQQSDDREKQLISAQNKFLDKEYYEKEHRELMRRVEALELSSSKFVGGWAAIAGLIVLVGLLLAYLTYIKK
jgi:hypothetical protein